MPDFIIWAIAYPISMYLFYLINEIHQKEIEESGHSSFLLFSFKTSLFLSLFSWSTSIFLGLYLIYNSQRFLSLLDRFSSSFEKAACKFEHKKDC